jgi:Arc/MetJ family transcription regulator
MRTSIKLDDVLVAKAQQLTGIKTKRELIDTALQAFVKLEEQSSAKSLKGKLNWEGDLDKSRQG